MKVLRDYKLPYLLIISCFLSTLAHAQNGVEALNDEKKEILKIDEKINDKSSTSLKYDWIEPVIGSYTYTISDQIGVNSVSKYYRVSFSQPIFKSGGIYFAIQYANANRAFKEIAHKNAKGQLVKTLYDSVLNLKKLDLEMKKIQYSINNAKIDIQRKKEQFDSGLLDSSFLDSSILNKTKLQHQLLNLKVLKYSQAKSFENISNYNYNEIDLPTFKSVQKEEFISKNLDISSKHVQKEQNRELKNMTISNYLPTISLFGNYNHKNDERQFFIQAREYKSYGIKISMPLFAVNRGRDIEIKKLEYLKAKIALKEQNKASVNEFLSLQKSIDILKQRVKISNEDLALYDSLIINADEGVSAGEKTQSDLQTLQNSKEISKIDALIFDIDIQLTLLKLYVKMSDEI